MVQMNQKQFNQEVNNWIQDINSKFNDFNGLSKIVKLEMENTEHNYELTLELKQEIEELKQEIKLLKIILCTMLKDKNKLELGIKRFK